MLSQLRGPEDLLSNDMELSPMIQQNLVVSAKWGKFLAIVGFISCLLLLLGAIGISMNPSSVQSYKNSFSGALAAVYIVMAILFFLPCLYLYRFSARILEAYKTSSQDSLENAFANLKAMFRFMGIITIISLAFYVLVIVFVIIGLNVK